MKQITEEMGIHKEWYSEAKRIKTDYELNKFKNKLLNEYNHDYGTICHAMTALGIATMTMVNNSPQGGITGFQAGAIMWEFIKNWNYTNNKCGMKLIDYDKMLFPQYNYMFEKTISKSTFKLLQEEAQRQLEEKDNFAHVDVVAHWRSIINGDVPFGYTLTDE